MKYVIQELETQVYLLYYQDDKCFWSNHFDHITKDVIFKHLKKFASQDQAEETISRIYKYHRNLYLYIVECNEAYQDFI